MSRHSAPLSNFATHFCTATTLGGVSRFESRAERKQQFSGFTLIEMLLSVTIIGVLAGLSTPLYQSFLARNDMDIAATTLAGTLRRAQVYARGAGGDSAWSVEIESTAITLFMGTDFAGRDTNFDEATSLSGTITASGLGEVQFSKLAAAPNTTGTITLTSNAGETRTVAINAKGTITY